MRKLNGHQRSGAFRMNGHYQSGGISIPLLNGFLSEATSTNWFSFGIERGKPLKLQFGGYSVAGSAQYRKTQWTDDTYLPVFVIPHCILNITDSCEINVGLLASQPFTCTAQPNLVIENKAFTVTTQAGGTFTFNALLGKIPKEDALTNEYFYYFRNFDVVFDNITGLGIKATANQVFRYYTNQCFVGDMRQTPKTLEYYFNIQDTEAFISRVVADVSDYGIHEVSGTIDMGMFGNNYTAVVPFTPVLQSTKIQKEPMPPSFYIRPKFSFSARGGISDNGIGGSYDNAVTSIYSFASKYACSDLEITPQKLSHDLFKIAIIWTWTSAVASTNRWSWTAS